MEELPVSGRACDSALPLFATAGFGRPTGD
jgi:hypothetical protein